jgi:hypothetical protein
MEAMQRYRLRTFPCDTADMTPNTISTLFPIRMGSHFVPFHSLSCPSIRLIRLIRLFFSHQKAAPARRKQRGIYPERLTTGINAPAPASHPREIERASLAHWIKRGDDKPNYPNYPACDLSHSGMSMPVTV